MYDADADCIEEAEEYNESNHADVRVYPYCVSQHDSQSVPFFINTDPFTSSLYQLNSEYKERYTNVYGFDYPLEESFSVNRKVDIETTSMDSLLDKTDIPSPDFLSLDVQGAELDILKGATSTLKTNTVALCLEVEFVELYKGQAKFGEICQFLASVDFEFARFIDIHEFSPYRGPIGTRGEGFHSYANVLFLKKPESISDCHSDLANTQLSLKKLAFISTVYNQTEFALQCLQQAETASPKVPSPPKETLSYLAFIDTFYQHMQQEGNYYPVSFGHFITSENGQGYPSKRFFHYAYQIEKVIEFLFSELSTSDKVHSKTETWLLKNGLKKQAETLWTNRVKQSLLEETLCESVLAALPYDTTFFITYLHYLKCFTTGTPRNAELHLNKALSLLSDEQPLAVAEKAPSLVYSIASFLKSLSHITVAKRLFMKLDSVLEQRPAEPTLLGNTHFHLGEIALKESSTAKAQSHFTVCLQEIPNHGKAKAYMESLKKA